MIPTSDKYVNTSKPSWKLINKLNQTLTYDGILNPGFAVDCGRTRKHADKHHVYETENFICQAHRYKLVIVSTFVVYVGHIGRSHTCVTYNVIYTRFQPWHFLKT